MGMREEFEAVWREKRYPAEDLRLDGNGDYEVSETYSAFYWFKASRAALCVELPQFDGWGVTGQAVIGAVNSCRDAIHAAGVSTK
jgi:hypothetical protein